MYSFTTDQNEISQNEWNDFVLNHPNGNIFHTPEMVEVYQVSTKSEPLVVVCFDESRHIVGILIAEVQREYKGKLGDLTARAIVWGGPLVMHNNAEVLSIILEEFDTLCKKKVVYSQFRNLWNTKDYSEVFHSLGYDFSDHLDIIFDLKKGEEILWKDIHPTRRKQINRGIKRDLQTMIVDYLVPEDLAKCYSILRNVYKEAKLPFPPITLFSNAIDFFYKKGYFKAGLALYKNEIIGFRFFLCYKGLLYDWYAASNKGHYDKYPNDILPWEILKWGSEKGYVTFDFGGAGKPNKPYGVRDYKIKFGGEIVNYGRFEKVHKPIIMFMARIGLKFWKLIKY